MRTFVIGDIHGAYKALVQCLERSNFDRHRDRLITLGDICDGWAHVKECVDELLTIDNRIDIIGNHDEWFHRWLKTGVHPDPQGAWKQGGSGTVESYAEAIGRAQQERWDFDDEGERAVFKYSLTLNPGDIPDEHRRFFMQQQLHYHDEERNYFFVHAGFDRWKSIEDCRHDDPSDFYWNRDLWKQAMNCRPGIKLQSVDDFDTIFIGHTATTCYRTKDILTQGGIIIPNGQLITTPIYSGNVYNIDTGAGSKGKLTIMDVDTKEFWQSDLVSTLYPHEKGRH